MRRSNPTSRATPRPRPCPAHAGGVAPARAEPRLPSSRAVIAQPRERITRALAVVIAALVIVACGGGNELGLQLPPRPAASPASAAPEALISGSASASPHAKDGRRAKSAVCPEDMVYVDTTYCPNVRLRCIKDEYSSANNITICHEFAPGQVCLGEPRRQRFCIDRYEYPNKKGEHPPVMVDWYDAAAACAAKSKRLCWESEWVSACEGPQKLPFPYGLRRDPSKCNIDNRWLDVELEKVYSKDPAVQYAELLHLDQSVPSGAKAGCVSGFGVRDLTGNLDEWVNAEQTHKKSKWAGLKGGAWGHVRNACRPITTSHPPEFTYYFISFRCCADATPDAKAARDPQLWAPPRQPSRPDPSGTISPGWTPRERGPNQPG